MQSIHERKIGQGRVDPGLYEKPGAFDKEGAEKEKYLERLVKRNKGHCVFSQQYSHIFTCMKPVTKGKTDGAGGHGTAEALKDKTGGAGGPPVSEEAPP